MDNLGQFQNHPATGSDDADKGIKRHAIDRELVMLEADQRKFLNEKIQLETEIRTLKKNSDRIRIDLQEKQARLETVNQENQQLEEAIKRLKRKLITL